jgi:hypothetical protein
MLSCGMLKPQLNGGNPMLFLCLAVMAAAQPSATGPDLDLLLNGVTEIVAPGCIVGPVAVYGDHAFPIITGGSGRSRLPILAGARYGKGRVVLAGHEGLIGTTDVPDQRRLIVNIAAWLCGERKTRRVVLVDARNAVPVLREAGFDVRTATAEELPTLLSRADAVFISGSRLTGKPDLVSALAKFIEAGGGYFDGMPGWGWQQLNPTLSLSDHYGGNKLTAPMGLVIADGMLDHTGKSGFLADRKNLDLSHAGRALKALSDHVAGTRKLEASDLAQVAQTLGNAAGAVPPDDRILIPRLRALTDRAGSSAIPTEKQPLGLDNPLGRIACVIQNIEMRRAPVAALHAHPAANAFPGAVPADAPRLTATVSVDTSVPDWASTGLYAPAGEAIEVRLPDGAEKAGLWVRIGPHTDTNWHHDRWTRFPDISYAAPLREKATRFGNPFGGLVYIVVPRDCKLGTISVTISGAVAAPLFVQGKTPLHQWRATIRKAPAPWAELATDKIILTVLSSVVRNLDDPEALMAVWDHGLDAIADLAGMPRKRERPERICTDMQISAGYMHSGYPIMTWLDVPATMVDRDKLVQGGSKTCWGFWHELGHNHQSGDWTFDGTGETTNNLFSLYCCERVSNEPVVRNGWLNVAQRNARVRKYFDDGAKFDEWKADPGLSLMFYAQLQQEFGWGAFQRLFAEYRQLPASERPRSDAQKRDQFLVRLSRQVGMNLGPFFTAWGIPTSDAARQSIANLPEWLPATFREGIPVPSGP